MAREGTTGCNVGFVPPFLAGETATQTALHVAKARSPERHEETVRLLKQEFGWGRCSCQKQQAQWAHLHLGLYALGFTQQTAFAHGQTIYAFRQSLFVQSIPQNSLALQ